MDTRYDSTLQAHHTNHEELRKRGTSRLWYRQVTDEPVDPAIPATYVARSTSLLSPEVVDRHETEEMLLQLLT